MLSLLLVSAPSDKSTGRSIDGGLTGGNSPDDVLIEIDYHFVTIALFLEIKKAMSGAPSSHKNPCIWLEPQNCHSNLNQWSRSFIFLLCCSTCFKKRRNLFCRNNTARWGYSMRFLTLQWRCSTVDSVDKSTETLVAICLCYSINMWSFCQWVSAVEYVTNMLGQHLLQIASNSHFCFI